MKLDLLQLRETFKNNPASLNFLNDYEDLLKNFIFSHDSKSLSFIPEPTYSYRAIRRVAKALHLTVCITKKESGTLLVFEKPPFYKID